MSHHHRAQLPVPTGRPYGDGGLERELRHVVSAAGTGALIGAAAAVGSLVGRSPLLSMATAFATATAVSYAILEAGGRRREG